MNVNNKKQKYIKTTNFEKRTWMKSAEMLNI